MKQQLGVVSMALFLAAGAASAQEAAPAPGLGSKEIPCYCRSPSGKTPAGETACIETAMGPKLAVCEQVLNNPSWRFISDGCQVAEAADGPMSKPTVQ